tara:strand:+ start:10873 stop:11301 length:429 start_codon:yes stop_codon:yes gene_type:complete
MNKKVKAISIIVLVGISLGIYLYLSFTDINTINITDAVSFKNTKSELLLADFKEDEKKADKFYTRKVIEVTGIVKEVSFLNNRNTLILQGEDKDSGVICDMNSNQIDATLKITEGQKVTIKGIYKGFLKDVVMLNCILITNN